MHKGNACSTCGINKRESFYLSEFTPPASHTTTAHTISISPAIVGAIFRVPARSLGLSLFNKVSVVFFPTPPILITFPEHTDLKKKKGMKKICFLKVSQSKKRPILIILQIAIILPHCPLCQPRPVEKLSNKSFLHWFNTELNLPKKPKPFQNKQSIAKYSQ